MIQLRVEGIQELNRNFDKKTVQINRESKNGLKAVAIKVLADAKQNLKTNRSIATGQVRDSGVVQEQKDESIDVIFKSNHSFFVEFGRKAGRMPPVDKIAEWVKKIGFADTYTQGGNRRKRGEAFYKGLKSIAFLIARKIGQKGTTPKPFLYPALRANEESVIREIKNAINKVV